MKPVPSDPAEHLLRVRQQLILAQVRIMELEDLRDELTPKLQSAEKLQAASQAIADEKADLARHLESVLGTHVAQLSAAERQARQSQQDLEHAKAEIRNLQARLEQLGQKCEQLGAELAAMKAARSWRWTAWLRSIGF